MTMAKASTLKSNPTPAVASVKPTKTRLNKDMKAKLLDYMEREFDLRVDDTGLAATFTALVARVNSILRGKYPEEDMTTLRKYNLTRVDSCLRFTILGTERVFGARLLPVGKVSGEVADIPCFGGCYNSEIFPCDKDFETLADRWTNQVEDRRRLVADKRVEYHAFLHACRYLEDVEAVLSLPDEIRKALGAASRSLSIISPDVLSRIKSDFAQGIAA
jgi:hypothetical protein